MSCIVVKVNHFFAFNHQLLLIYVHCIRFSTTKLFDYLSSQLNDPGQRGKSMYIFLQTRVNQSISCLIFSINHAFPYEYNYIFSINLLSHVQLGDRGTGVECAARGRLQIFQSVLQILARPCAVWFCRHSVKVSATSSVCSRRT